MKIFNLKEQLLSQRWKPLRWFEYDYLSSKGQIFVHKREVYDKGDGACVLMIDKVARTILLTQQFRLPTFLNGNQTGVLLEVPAGMLDGEDPVTCIKKEIEEETGHVISDIKRVGDCYMTPGAVTERTYFFIANYSCDTIKNGGGGCLNEQEDIVLITIPFDEIKQMALKFELKDAKTMLILQYAILHKLLD